MRPSLLVSARLVSFRPRLLGARGARAFEQGKNSGVGEDLDLECWTRLNECLAETKEGPVLSTFRRESRDWWFHCSHASVQNTDMRESRMLSRRLVSVWGPLCMFESRILSKGRRVVLLKQEESI